mmetsp:Transcript_3526/g.10834  ORF Transcript_3526/g.10834 Transcript_3526/m.10834 type:complete len:200 (-) Transcript_3526:382-981(-)
MNLQNRRAPLGADVVDDDAAGLQDHFQVLSVDLGAGHSVEGAEFVEVRILSDVRRERVDRPAVVYDEKQYRQRFLRRSVQALRETPVLAATLSHEDHGHAVVVRHAVQQNRPRGADGVRQLLRHQSPPALEMGVDVVHVHRAAGAAARSRVLGEQFGHDFLRRHARSQSVRVLSVVGILFVRPSNAVRDERRNGLLAVI